MTIRTATAQGVMTLEIARPEKKNALTMAMYDALSDGLRAARADNAVRAVLIAGQPGAFTAGNDLEDFLHRPPAGEDNPILRFMHALRDCEKPVIAAVTGLAVGIGVTMLLHCDLVYVSEDARLSMPFVSIGLVPEYASSLLVPQLVGQARAAELLLLGEPFSGSDAVKLGIANAALPAGEVLSHARRMAERFNALPAGAVRETKRLLRAPFKEDIARVIRAEADVFVDRLRSPEAKEAFQAFLEKRKPDFSKL